MKKLERRLSLPYVIAIGIGGMLGSGIFVLPGIAAAKTGPSIWLAYLLAGICVLPAALSKSELATAMPTSGGTYVYIERAFGPTMGTISGIGLWLSLLLKSSFALVGFGAYLAVLAHLNLKSVALISLGLILLLNIMGVKKVGKAQLVIVAVSLVGLAALIFSGILSVEPSNLEPAFLHGNMGLYAATAFVFVSYAGVTKVAAIAEEIKNPGRNLPVAMLLALVVVTVLYTLISFAMVGNIPIEELSTDLHPVYTLADRVLGSWAGIAAAILGVVTLISMANSGVLAASRFPFAMSRDKLAPEILGRVHAKYLTPVLAIVLTCGLMALVIIFLEVEKIAKLASSFKVMMFILVNLCVIVLRETSVAWYQPKYRSPLYPWMQIFGILSGLGLLYVLGASALLGATVIVIAGLLMFYLYGKSRVQRSGVLKVYGHRPAAFLLYRRKNAAEKAALQHAVTPTKDANLDGALASNAMAVTPLFGAERSAEMLVEMSAALAHGNKVQVVHLREVPDQTRLSDLLDDDPKVLSLNRRIQVMAGLRKVDVDFDAAVTHDLVQTVQDISEQTHCRWLVAGWNGRQTANSIFVRNPMGWLLTHIDSNFALFLDNGVRYIRRIVVAIRPGRENQTFIQACDRIAQFYQAELTLLRVVKPNATEERQQEMEAQSRALLQHCSAQTHLRIERSSDPVQAISEASAEYDLLIIGTPDKENWLDVLVGVNKDRFAKDAACSVLRLTFR